MKRIAVIVAFSALSMIAFAATMVSAAITVATDFMLSIIPTFVSKGAFSLDNGHPRSPIASMRAGLA